MSKILRGGNFPEILIVSSLFLFYFTFNLGLFPVFKNFHRLKTFHIKRELKMRLPVLNYKEEI